MKAAISYRHRWRAELLATADGPDALEVVADHFFARADGLDALAARYPIVLHDVACSVATGGPTPERLRRLVEVARRSRAVAFSDHLAVTRSSDGIDLGHLCPPWYRPEVLDVVVDAVHRLQDALQIPVNLENIASAFDVPHAGQTEGEFWHALVERTGCGVLLDVTNVLLDARNRGTDPLERLNSLPLDAVAWVHLAGGRAEGAFWVDSHSSPVEEESYALLAAAQVRPEGVIVEWDRHLPPLAEVIAEARRAVRARSDRAFEGAPRQRR